MSAAAAGRQEWTTASEEETRDFGERLAAALAPRGCCLLFGAMATGTTVLAQGIARGLGIEPREVQSPTFTLVREHQGRRGRLLHLDLYRLDAADLPGLGLDEILDADAVVVIEWAERLPAQLRLGARAFLVERLDEQRRRIVELPPARVMRMSGADVGA
jgi:tRNA threonylcarbamoyladenosine biosynthesis protein TsaE